MLLKLLQIKRGDSQKLTATAIELHTCKGHVKAQNPIQHVWCEAVQVQETVHGQCTESHSVT